MEGMYNNPPPAQFTPFPPQTVAKPERGGFLTFILVLRFIADVFLVLTSLGVMALLSHEAKTGADIGDGGRAVGNTVTLLLGVTCIDLAGVAGVLSWKKWGVYLLGGCEILGLVLKLQEGHIASAMVGLATLMLAGFGIAMRWRYFD
jgi:hypothetical protein